MSEDDVMARLKVAYDREAWAEFIISARHALSLELDKDVSKEVKRDLTTALLHVEPRSQIELEEAAALCVDLLKDTEPGSQSGRLLERRLGYIYEKLGSEMFRNAVRHYESALGAESLEPTERATMTARAGYARMRSGDVHARVREHFEQASSVFTAFEFPEEFAEMLEILLALKPCPLTTIASSQVFTAIESGDFHDVGELLRVNRHLDATDYDGCTALQIAISEGHFAFAEELIRAGANRLTRDHRGYTMLHWAIYPDVVRGLELSISDTISLNPQDVWGRTPVACAASLGLTTALSWLLNRGAHANLQDVDGWSPLHHAVAANNEQALKILLAAGASRNVRSAAGEMPAETATRLGHAALQSVLAMSG